MKIGEKAPAFELPGVDGKAHALDALKGAKATIVVFSCNHCPYVVLNEDRLIAVARDYAAKGVGFAAINANDAENYPEDSFSEMKKRATEKQFPFPYLRDESQGVARAYGATHTPHLFVFDEDLKLAYTGAVDDDSNFKTRKKAEKLYLRDAIDDLIAGRPVRVPETHAIGCTIKWEVIRKIPFAVWPLLAAGTAWIGLMRFERMMVFVPSRTMTAHPGSVGLPFERLWLTASDGTRLRAWWIPGPRADAPVLLCLHGNGANISSRTDKMKIFHDLGAAQLWLDWRGYGESSGTPDEAGLYRDGLAGWDWLTRERGAPPARVALYGESLGCGVAVELATRVPAGGLIVDSGFASIAEMGRAVLPWFPVALERIRFDNLAKLPRVTMPVLFLHSPQDDVVPYEQALRNFAAAAGPKSFTQLHGPHNDAFLEAGPAYAEAIRAFLAMRIRQPENPP